MRRPGVPAAGLPGPDRAAALGGRGQDISCREEARKTREVDRPAAGHRPVRPVPGSATGRPVAGQPEGARSRPGEVVCQLDRRGDGHKPSLRPIDPRPADLHGRHATGGRGELLRRDSQDRGRGRGDGPGLHGVTDPVCEVSQPSVRELDAGRLLQHRCGVSSGRPPGRSHQRGRRGRNGQSAVGESDDPLGSQSRDAPATGQRRSSCGVRRLVDRPGQPVLRTSGCESHLGPPVRSGNR